MNSFVDVKNEGKERTESLQRSKAKESKKMRPIIGLAAWLIGFWVWAQTDSTKNNRLRELNTEVANLTRSPLGKI